MVQSETSRTLVAFVLVPVIASAWWYITMLVYLLIGNGRLRLRTDVAAMALGAVILGLPVAVLITLVFAVPVYYFVRRFAAVNLKTSVAAGVSVGFLIAACYWVLAHQWDILSPMRAAVIGGASGAMWWRFAGRPGVGSKSTTCP